MGKFFVVNDPEVEEPSGIKVVAENGTTLVYLKGPMSMTAAGIFIKALLDPTQDTSSPINTPLLFAREHWRD